MKYLTAYIATLIFSLLGISIYTVGQTHFQHYLFAAFVFFFLIIFILGLAPFFINAYHQGSNWVKAFLVLCLFLYSALILYYNIAIWAMFVLLFTAGYYAIFRIGRFEIKDNDFPLRYLLGMKGYLNVVIICWAIFSAFFWLIYFLGCGYNYLAI